MANQVTTTFRINADGAINALNRYNTQLQKSVQLQKQLGGSATAGGGGRGGGGGATGGGGGVAIGGLPNLGALTAGIVSLGSAIQVFSKSIDGIIAYERGMRSLAASGIEAGKTFDVLAQSSNRFAKSAGISEGAAAKSTSQLLRLLTLAGKTDELEKYQQGFLDLAAARGVGFDELDSLFSGIIAGTDDALNRFGKADPSKLAAAYAKSVGKTTEELTGQEQVLSRLNAVSEDFDKFAGANQDRMQSFDGQVAKFNATLDDTLTKFGEFIARNQTINGLLQATNLLLGGGARNEGTNQKAQIARLIKEGLSPVDVALRLGKDYAGFGTLAPLTEQRKEEIVRSLDIARLTGTGSPVTERSKTNPAAFGNILGQATREAQIQGKSAEDIAAKNEAAASEERLKARQREASELEKQLTREARLRSLNLSVYEAQFNTTIKRTVGQELQETIAIGNARLQAIREEANARLGLFAAQFAAESDSGKRSAILDEQNAFIGEQRLAYELERLSTVAKINQLEEKRAESIKQITRDLRGESFGVATEQNPYVKIFSDAQSAAEDLIKKTEEFGKKFKASIIAGIEQRGNLALLAQDINNLRGATSLRREARELLFGIDPSQFSPEQAQEYRRRTIQEDIQAIDDAYSRSQRGASAERLRDQAIIQATQGVSFRELYQGDRAEAISAREREATRLEQDRDKAREVFDRILSEFGSGGIPVKLVAGQSTITIIDESNGRAEVATRPTPASTRARY